MTPRPTTRKPLQALPLADFVPSAASSPSSKSTSPKKRPGLLGDMSLLPSPFLASNSPKGPLATLYEAPPHSSPRRRRVLDAGSLSGSPSRAMLARDEEERRADDEMPQASPRRLFDAFVGERRSSPSLGMGAGSPGKGSQWGSMPPPSPKKTGSPFVGRQKEEKQEEEPMPTWSFYQDDDDDMSASSSGPSAAVEDAAMHSADDEADDTPVDKENNRPPPMPRRRSTSLLSHASTPTLAAPSPTVASTSSSATNSAAPSPTRAPPPPLPFLPPVSLTAQSVLSPRTPPPGSSSPGFPAFLAVEAHGTNPFAEAAASSFSPVVSAAEGGAGLLPAFQAGAGGGRKRLSAEGAEREGKKPKVDEEPVAEEA
ncbi:hypothetical protein JCM10213_003864 [Rhodosporidiobolus nylandii]